MEARAPSHRMRRPAIPSLSVTPLPRRPCVGANIPSITSPPYLLQCLRYIFELPNDPMFGKHSVHELSETGFFDPVRTRKARARVDVSQDTPTQAVAPPWPPGA